MDKFSTSCAAATDAVKPQEIKAKIRIIAVPFDYDIGGRTQKAKGNSPLGHNNFTINPIDSFPVHSDPQWPPHTFLQVALGYTGLRAMDIILHLGAHRCASTTFQSFLHNNRSRLAMRGLTCWSPKRTRDGLLRGLMRHPAFTTVQDELNGQRSIRRVQLEIEGLALEGQSALLISEENLIGTMRNNILDARLYPLLRERLRKIAPALRHRPLKIGLCVRSYENYWTSSLANLMVRGWAQPSVEVLNLLATQPRYWRTVVQDIAAVFPDAEIIVWPFERMANRPAAQLDVLWSGDTTGLENDNIWRNRTGEIVHLNKILKLRGDAPLQNGLIASNRRWMPFDKNQRATLRAEYRRDLAWLSAGAEGLARYVDGWPTPATRPDRADVIRANVPDVALLRGRFDGIEKRLG